MKMRKILPLVILAVGSLFLLSSCDAMLDAIFSSNQITVDVWVTASTHPDYPVGAYISTTVVDNNTGTTYTATSSWQSYDGYYVHYYLTFRKLKDDNFTIISTYYNYLGGVSGSTGNLWDYTGTVYLGTSITMPSANPLDSTGHSITVVQVL